MFLISLIAVAASSPLTAAADEVAAAKPVEKVLPSGAESVLWQRPGSGTVLIAVAVPAGSQDELPTMAGLSHYLEHLLFDGFDDFDERGVTESFESLSVYMNAFTREQTTVFFALAPRENAPAAAALVAGMLTRSKIVPATYEKEKKVILEELAKDHASPSGLEEELLRALLWQRTPLQHPVGGYVDTVEATTRDEVIRYWNARYGAGGYRLLITGDLPVAGLEAVLAPFEKLDRGPALPARPDQLSWTGWGEWQAEPAPEGTDAESAMPAMGMGMGGGMRGSSGEPAGGTLAVVLAAPDSLSEDGTAIELVSRWLGDPAGPLAADLVPGAAGGVSVTRLPRDPRDLLEVRVDAAAGVDPENLVARVLGGLAAAANGPTDVEVMDIQRSWAAERALTGQRLHYAAVFYGEALAAGRGPLSEALDPPVLNPEDVRTAATALLTDFVGRTRAAWLGDGGPMERAPLPKPIFPAPRAAVSTLESGPFGSLVATLANGMVVGILPENGADVFGVHLLVADRTLYEPEDAPGVADLIHRLLPGGTVLAGSRELANRIERAGIEVKAADSPMIPFDNRYHVPDFSYVRIEGPARSFGQAVEMLAEMVRVPAWDDEGWRIAVEAHEAEIAADNRGGEMVAQILAAALLGPDNPLAKPVSGRPGEPTEEPARVREIWGTWPEGYFAPDRLVLTVASPVPPERALELIVDAFSGGVDATPRRGPYPEPQPQSAPRETDLVETPQVTLLWGRLADVRAEDRAAVLVAMDAFSDRMVAVIREQEGLAYRLGASARDVQGAGWILSAVVGTRPENRDRVAELLQEIVDNLATNPLDADDLARLNARERRSRMLRSLSAASRADRLGRALFE
ncbi:MAG: insulinase family protein, partial [Acidobacteriota bacterium]